MLILVRHGRTALNAAGRLQGRLDEPLDDVGRQQAAVLAARVGPVDALICSPLARAVQTAEAFGTPFQTDDRWVELAYGIYEGVNVADVDAAVWERWLTDVNSVAEGGESLATLDKRVREACDALADQARNENVAVVSHVSPIKAAVAWALGAGVEIAWRSHLSHASICRIDIRSRGPVLITFNETATLPG